MVVEIADIVKGYLAPLTFIDRLAGLVKTITKTDMDKDNRPVKKTFPVGCNVASADCITTGVYTDLVPNNKYGCIVYLEENGPLRKVGSNGANEVWKGSYRLVGWVNQKKLGTNSCSITGQIILSILNQIPKTPSNVGIYQRLLVDVQGQDPKSYIPFSKYTYDEDKTQYLMYPFDYFSLPIEVEFQMHPSCATAFVKQTQINCNN